MATTVSKKQVPSSNKCVAVVAVPHRSRFPKLLLSNPEQHAFYSTLMQMIPADANNTLKAELDAAATDLAKRLCENGFTDLCYRSEYHHSIFTAVKDSKLFKIKVIFGNAFAQASSYLDPRDQTRGEYCILRHLMGCKQAIKQELDFGNDFYRARSFRYIEGNTLLEQVINAKYPKDLPFILISLRRYMQIASFMHKKRIAHRDLKLENAVVNQVDVYSIDHDSARYMPSNELSLSPRGSIACSSMQRLQTCCMTNNGYDPFGEDEWSTGVMIIEACTQRWFPLTRKIGCLADMIAYLEGDWKREDQFKLETVFQKKGIPVEAAKRLANLSRGLMHEEPHKRMKISAAVDDLGKIILELESQIKIAEDSSSSASEASGAVEAGSLSDTSGASDTSGDS